MTKINENIKNHEELVEYYEKVSNYIEARNYKDAADNMRLSLFYIIDNYVKEYVPYACALTDAKKTNEIYKNELIDDATKRKWDTIRVKTNKNLHRDFDEQAIYRIKNTYESIINDFLDIFPKPSDKEIPEEFRLQKYNGDPLAEELDQYSCVYQVKSHEAPVTTYNQFGDKIITKTMFYNVWFKVDIRIKNIFFDERANSTGRFNISTYEGQTAKIIGEDDKYIYISFNGKESDIRESLTRFKVYSALSEMTDEQLKNKYMEFRKFAKGHRLPRLTRWGINNLRLREF